MDVDDIHAIRAVRERLSAGPPAGVAFDPDAMKAMMNRLAAHHGLFPFHKDHDGVNRFYYDNPFFGCHDASVYFSMLLEFRPKRVVEIGSGFSSRLLLDSSEQYLGSEYLGSETEITLIDPSPGTLDDLGPTTRTRMLSCPVQDAPVELFDELDANDILFVDSSHVGKTGSDVNYYLFRILPRLKPGVIIHIHDMFWPFEYLPEWVLADNRSWNEAYLVHAFLQYNQAFEILYWNNYAFHFLSAELREAMPLCMENEGGSLWIRKV